MPDFTNSPDHFLQVLDKIKATHLKKRADYSDPRDPFSNFKEAALMAGITTSQSFELLIGIKQARIKQLLQPNRIAVNESLEDSLLDRAVYAFLALAYFMEQTDEYKPIDDDCS